MLKFEDRYGNQYRVRWFHDRFGVQGTRCILECWVPCWGAWRESHSAQVRLHRGDSFSRAGGRWFSFRKLLDPHDEGGLVEDLRGSAWKAFFEKWPHMKNEHP